MKCPACHVPCSPVEAQCPGCGTSVYQAPAPGKMPLPKLLATLGMIFGAIAGPLAVKDSKSAVKGVSGKTAIAAGVGAVAFGFIGLVMGVTVAGFRTLRDD